MNSEHITIYIIDVKLINYNAWKGNQDLAHNMDRLYIQHNTKSLQNLDNKNSLETITI